MKAHYLKTARRRRGWTQQEAAARLGLSQPYLSMLETGGRSLPASLARRVVRLFALAPTALPPSEPVKRRKAANNQTLAEELAKLGYPGFAYLLTRCRTRNPAQVLLEALAMDDLEARLAEALPWLLLQFEGLDAGWLSAQVRLRNLQNRLGFVVSLARRVAEANPRRRNRVQPLLQLERDLEPSRLLQEDTLCQSSLSAGERRWLRARRPQAAAHWNLLTNWRPEHLPYAS